jgi:hypothetical protein
MEQTDNYIGKRLQTIFKDRNIVIKHFLKKLQDLYPEERGLTENGFKYSLENNSIKASLLIKIAWSLDLTLADILPEEYIMGKQGLSSLLKINEIQTKRIEELEMDKKQYLDKILLLEERIKLLTDQSGKSVSE